VIGPRSPAALTIIAALIAVVISVLDLAIGAIDLTPTLLWQSLLHGPGGTELSDRILWSSRLPRCVLALVAGATLAQAGALLQTVTRNPLADPFLFGLSSGAAAGAVGVIVVFGASLHGAFMEIWAPALGAACGALAATAILMLLMASPRTRGASGISRLVLGGIAVSFLFSTLTSLLVFAGDRNTAQSILFWSMGGFGAARWDALPIAVAGLSAIALFAGLYGSRIDAFRAGEDTARSLGISTTALRRATILVCALSCGSVVCICGPIPFVGLVVPHLATGLSRAPIRRCLPLTALLGAILCIAADLACRRLLPDQELPVGVAISAIGSVFLIVMILRETR